MSNQLVSDSYLVAQYVNGDESALLELLERHQLRVYCYINNNIKSACDVDDVFQETFFKVIIGLKKGEYKEKEKFLNWVLSITYHTIVEYFRVQKKLHTTHSTIKNAEGKVVDIFTKVIIPETEHEQTVEGNQQRKRIRKLIRHLTFEQRQVIILRHYFGMSFSEIAIQMNTNTNTTLGRMRLGLRNLNKLMRQPEGNFEEKLAINRKKMEEKNIYFDYHTIKS